MIAKNIISRIFHKFPNYWLPNLSGSYVQVGRFDLAVSIKKRAALIEASATKKDIRETIAWISENQSIDYVLPRLPGYGAGVHRINNATVLVPEALRVIEPSKGNLPITAGILERMLGPDQLIYFLAWLQTGYLCLKENTKKPGQVVILAGPQACGKNLVQEQIITPVFGGSYAEPYRYAVGKTQFNMDHYKAMHLMIADQKNPAERADMQEYIRRIASNNSEQLHPKNKEAISIEVLWRMSISCNQDEKDLRIIPPLDGLEDKVMLFKCALAPMPMPTAEPAQYKAFQDVIRAETGALIDRILEFKIPDSLRHQRFGVKGFLHPELARNVNMLGTEESLLGLIRDHKRHKPEWILSDISAGEIHAELFKQDNLREALRKIAYSPMSVGKLLAKLVE